MSTTTSTPPSSRFRTFRKLRPLLSVAGRRKTGRSSPPTSAEVSQPIDPYTQLSPWPDENPPPPPLIKDDPEVSDTERRVREGYEWEVESEASSVGEQDGYSWIDPSVVGTDKLRRTPATSNNGNSNGITPPDRSGVVSPISEEAVDRFPDPPTRPARPKMPPQDSYNLLLSYQSQSLDHSSGSSSNQHSYNTPFTSAEGPFSRTTHAHTNNTNPEWHEMVPPDLLESLSGPEKKRQGLWWELIKGEREYVRDLKIICQTFVEPLKRHDPPLLIPETRLNAFIAEVFSTVGHIYAAHTKLLDRLNERQREHWPLLTSATDLLLGTFLEIVSFYETYMKNYPFAEARIRRESQKNEPFREFLDDRNTLELTHRRDISVFLSRPVTRLPRLKLLIENILNVTPTDHPDAEEIPTVLQVLNAVIRSSQPGIESAEAKIKLWNVAERLLFKKGEIIELDIAEPKRALVHAGYVYRRVRSETNWHGWQDLHAFLLDNYFLLARDEEHGKHIVVSRPIHLDFLTSVTADGVPERRWDSVSQYKRRPGGNVLEPIFQPERIAYPFTVSFSIGHAGRSYTLCTGTEAARQTWKEKVDSARTLRQFDLESNRIFATHTISVNPAITAPILAADTFQWLGRETIAVATAKSVWIGWKRDSRTCRELVHMNTGMITAISVVPDFGWLIILSSGCLFAFDLRELIPASDPSVWASQSRSHGHAFGGSSEPTSSSEKSVSWFRIGTTKERLLLVYTTHSRHSHQTNFYFEEPLLPSSEKFTVPFRRFATMTIPGFATDMSFFRQTIACVTEKGFVIAEPGNPTFNNVPNLTNEVRSEIVRMVNGSKSMGMYQVGENEFLLVYDWGACFVTKYGEISRHNSYLRWNVLPTHAVFRPPHLLLFDESAGRAEVRDVISGRMCEVIHERGMKPVRACTPDGDLLVLSPRGLLQLVETVEL